MLHSLQLFRTEVDEQAEIIAHLRHLLSMRQGSLHHLPDMGLPDLADIYAELPYSARIFADAVKKQIEKYEPRITRVKVNVSQNNFSMTAELQSIISLDIIAKTRNLEQLIINTNFLNNGEAKLQFQDYSYV